MVATGDNLKLRLEINKKYVLRYFLKLVIFHQIFFSFDVENIKKFLLAFIHSSNQEILKSNNYNSDIWYSVFILRIELKVWMISQYCWLLWRQESMNTIIITCLQRYSLMLMIKVQCWTVESWPDQWPRVSGAEINCCQIGILL